MRSVSRSTYRHIHRLRVRSMDSGQVRPVATLIEDALRTASFPMADHGRLLVIRRLDLGRISRQMTASSTALQVERVVRDITARAASFDLPDAADRDAVLFPSHAEALVRLARAHARGRPTPEWFWPMLLPGWRSGSRENWIRLLDAVHQLPEAPVAAAAIVRETIQARAVDDMMCAVPAERPRLWLHAAGWENPAPTKASSATPGLKRFVTQMALRLQADRFPSEDHWVWLLTLLAAGEQPARAGDPNLPAAIRYCLASISRKGIGCLPQPSSKAGLPAGDSTSDSTDALRSTEDQDHRSPDRGSTSPPANGQPPTPGSRTGVESAAAIPTATERFKHSTAVATTDFLASRVIKDDSPTLCTTSPESFQIIEQDAHSVVEVPQLIAQASHGAGLLFLAPILARLDFARWLTDQPAWLESDFPARLLRFIGEHVGLAPDDPAMIALEFGRPSASFNSPPDTGDSPDRASAAEPDLRSTLPTPARALLAAPEPRGTIDTPFAAWHCVIRRWCRRNARLGLSGLIRRPGWLCWSRTHIDVDFDLSRIDLRLRRLALDVDPGWVPWLGRVVQFHYRSLQ
jgi:hypothetical protein